MTVNELIEKLIEFKKQGFGDYGVVYPDSYEAIEGCSNHYDDLNSYVGTAEVNKKRKTIELDAL